MLYLVTLLGLLPNYVFGQFPLTGDQSAMHKMKAEIIFEKATHVRLEKKEEGLADRALHFMKAREKFQERRDFIERGSAIFPDSEEPIEANANVGEQIIDPRTPQGFGDPFFRQMNVELNVQLDSIMSPHEMKEVRLQNDNSLYAQVASGWILMEGRGNLASTIKDKGSFIAWLFASPNKIIRRQCTSCKPDYRDIFYRRITTEGVHRRLLDMMVGGTYGFHESDCGSGERTCKVSNICGVDFTIHSNYQDAVNGENPWEYCETMDFGEGIDMFNTTNTIGFPGYSGKKHKKKDQYTQGDEGQSDYAYSVEETNWIPLWGSGIFHIGGYVKGVKTEIHRLNNADTYLAESGHMIIRRICTSCSDPRYQDIYYRRLVPPPDDVDLWNIIGRAFYDQPGNIRGRDYELFSSYDDAVNFENAWQACEPHDGEVRGFPGRCRPLIDDDPLSYEGQWSISRENELYSRKRNAPGSTKDIAIYIEGPGVPETGEWMTEDDEMRKFLWPESTLDANDDITCKDSALTLSESLVVPGQFNNTDLKPYVMRGRDDPYAGWYDVQGCGECTEWCGWFSSDDEMDGGMNPLYQSWTRSNDFFACISGSTSHTTLRTSGYDSTPFDATFVPDDLKAEGNQYASFLEFFPTLSKCSGSFVAAPKLKPYEYVGCYRDTADRALPHYQGNNIALEDCHTLCREKGYHYFGRQNFQECWCGGSDASDTSYAKHGKTVSNVPLSDDGAVGGAVNGIETDVPDSEINAKNWTMCYSSLYADSSESPIVDEMADCTGSNIMYGCAPVDSDVWTLVGYGSKEKAMTATNNPQQGTTDGVVHWYFDSDRSMGFANAGSDISLNSCDFLVHDDPHRLCWHKYNGRVVNGWRCGANVWLNWNSAWKRAIWSSGGTPSSLTFSPPMCVDCEGIYQGPMVNCVYRIRYDEEYYPSGTCESYEGHYQMPSLMEHFTYETMPYKFQIPSKEDPFEGYYDVQRCGKCNDYCFWLGPGGQGSGQNPEWLPYINANGTDYFACKLAGDGGRITQLGHFGKSFRYQKCEGEGADTPAYRTEEYLGCFYDDADSRALPFSVGDNYPKISLQECADSCRARGYHYFGMQNYGHCFCGGDSYYDESYKKYGEIDPSSNEFTCHNCESSDMGLGKQCVYRILDQFDPEFERNKHPCSHIPFVDVRRLCYVSCRDADEEYKNLLACKTLSVTGLKHLNNEIGAWRDSPVCDNKECLKGRHPLGNDVKQNGGVF